jgi:hypothetical protein
MVPGSRITSRVPSSEIRAFCTVFSLQFWRLMCYAMVPEQALDGFADVGRMKFGTLKCIRFGRTTSFDISAPTSANRPNSGSSTRA